MVIADSLYNESAPTPTIATLFSQFNYQNTENSLSGYLFWQKLIKKISNRPFSPFGEMHNRVH